MKIHQYFGDLLDLGTRNFLTKKGLKPLNLSKALRYFHNLQNSWSKIPNIFGKKPGKTQNFENLPKSKIFSRILAEIFKPSKNSRKPSKNLENLPEIRKNPSKNSITYVSTPKN